MTMGVIPATSSSATTRSETIRRGIERLHPERRYLRLHAFELFGPVRSAPDDDGRDTGDFELRHYQIGDHQEGDREVTSRTPVSSSARVRTVRPSSIRAG